MAELDKKYEEITSGENNTLIVVKNSMLSTVFSALKKIFVHNQEQFERDN